MVHMQHCFFMKGESKATAAWGVIEEFASDCLLMRTRLISRVLTGIYDQALREFGINSPQFSLLVVISKMAPASRAEIGRYHHQDRSTLTRNLKIMIENGWIEESLADSVGRARPIVVTNAGSVACNLAISSSTGNSCRAVGNFL